MKREGETKRGSGGATLLAEFLRWFIRLRWLAGTVVVVAAATDWLWLHWYGRGGARVVAEARGWYRRW